MPGMSTHPLVGLPHKCDVVRKVPLDDGAGGVSEGDAEVTVYPKRTCRVSSLDPNDVELRGYGFDPKRHMKVVMVYSPKVTEVDVLKVPWGVTPNVVTPLGLPDGFAPKYVLQVTSVEVADIDSIFSPILLWPPFLTVTLTSQVVLEWDGTEFRDETVNFRVYWNGSVWVFEDVTTGFTHEFTGFRRNQNIFKRPWPVEVGPSYKVLSDSASATAHRIVWAKHQIDEYGRWHHTSLVIQLEKPDT